MISKTEQERIEVMVKGMQPLPRALSIIVLTLLLMGVFFAIYAIVVFARGESFAVFKTGNVIPAMLITLVFMLITRHYWDWFSLKVTRQYNDAAFDRGLMIPSISLKERAKQFIPTLASWKWLLLVWFIANALDCVSTYLALHYGIQEANPTARAATNMYVSKWVGVISITFIGVFFQWKSAMGFLAVMVWLVVLSNFATLGMALVQPSLVDTGGAEVSMPAYMIKVAETAVIAALILWGRDIWETIKNKRRRS